MYKEEIAPGIVIYSNVINNYETLINDIEEGIVSANITWNSAGVYDGENKPPQNKKTRDTDSVSVPYQGYIDEDYKNLLDAFYKTLSNIFFISFDKLELDYKHMYGIDFIEHSNYDILKYGKNQKFTNHIDDHQKFPRRISTVYYINENYSGGEILFPRFNISYKPKANQLLIFPSNYVYNHSVNEVTDGTRYAVVSWIK